MIILSFRVGSGAVAKLRKARYGKVAILGETREIDLER